MMRFAARDLAAAGLPPQRIFVSLERNMKCGVGLCGHCQLGPLFVCRDGPVFSYDRLAPLLRHREL
jgi:NAD(P)H-flavin reductase